MVLMFAPSLTPFVIRLNKKFGSRKTFMEKICCVPCIQLPTHSSFKFLLVLVLILFVDFIFIQGGWYV